MNKDAETALTFQRVIHQAVLVPAWTRAHAEAMRESNLTFDQALSTLATMTAMTDTPNIFFFPHASFERIAEYHPPEPGRRRTIGEILPTRDGVLIFENDIIVPSALTIAYSAIYWQGGVTTTIIETGEEALDSSTVFMLVYRVLNDPEEGALYMTPLIISNDEATETIVAPAYNLGDDDWKHGLGAILQHFGEIIVFLNERIPIVTTSRQQDYTIKGRKKVAQKQRTIKVITLRAVAPLPAPTAAEIRERERRQIEWSCRWTVREHDRHLRNGRVVKVRAHQKGPVDLPLREYERTVYDIAR